MIVETSEYLQCILDVAAELRLASWAGSVRGTLPRQSTPLVRVATQTVVYNFTYGPALRDEDGATTAFDDLNQATQCEIPRAEPSNVCGVDRWTERLFGQ